MIFVKLILHYDWNTYSIAGIFRELLPDETKLYYVNLNSENNRGRFIYFLLQPRYLKQPNVVIKQFLKRNKDIYQALFWRAEKASLHKV